MAILFIWGFKYCNNPNLFVHYRLNKLIWLEQTFYKIVSSEWVINLSFVLYCHIILAAGSPLIGLDTTDDRGAFSRAAAGSIFFLALSLAGGCHMTCHVVSTQSISGELKLKITINLLNHHEIIRPRDFSPLKWSVNWIMEQFLGTCFNLIWSQYNHTLL